MPRLVHVSVADTQPACSGDIMACGSDVGDREAREALSGSEKLGAARGNDLTRY